MRAQRRRFLQRADLRAIDHAHAPFALLVPPGERDMSLRQRKPRFTEPQRVVEVGERIELYGVSVTRMLDPRANLPREPRRLTDVACDDFLVHVGDPLKGPRLGRSRG